MTTILKLHSNGDFEAVGVDVITELFSENLIDFSRLVDGYISSTGTITIDPGATDKTTHFISVSVGEIYTIETILTDSSATWLYLGFSEFDANQNFIRREHLVDRGTSLNHKSTWVCPPDVAYVRISLWDIARYSNSFKLHIKPSLTFTENSITLPPIIELPSSGYRNYFIEKTSVPGYVYDERGLQVSNEHDRTSDYIDITGWTNTVIISRFNDMTGDYRAWIAVTYYNQNKEFLLTAHEDYHTGQGTTGDIVVNLSLPTNANYMRVSANYYDNPNSKVKLSIEKGAVGTDRHYLAPEDLPDWVRDTGNPVSIFPQGIVIKGNLIQTP